MNANSSRPVVVGVDGSPGSLAAIHLAAEEARRLSTQLTLVHVVPSYTAMPPAPMMALPPADLREMGQEILDACLAEARSAAPDLTIEAELRPGARHLALAQAATNAALLVVGQDSRALIDRLILGNTTTGVACRAACPVASVPPGWDPDRGHGVIVVGVKSPSHTQELMADAFAVASARDARLLLLHAWKLPGGYDDIVADRVSVQEFNDRATKELEDVLVPWREAYPHVAVETQVVHDYAARALAHASRAADLLIVVRRAHGVPAATHLGGTARAVLRTASCPVRVVPAVATGAAPSPQPAHAHATS